MRNDDAARRQGLRRSSGKKFNHYRFVPDWPLPAGRPAMQSDRRTPAVHALSRNARRIHRAVRPRVRGNSGSGRHEGHRSVRGSRRSEPVRLDAGISRHALTREGPRGIVRSWIGLEGPRRSSQIEDDRQQRCAASPPRATGRGFLARRRGSSSFSRHRGPQRNRAGDHLLTCWASRRGFPRLLRTRCWRPR